MRWTERQRAMLREMGVRLWPGDAADALVATEPSAAAPGPTATAARAERSSSVAAHAPVQEPASAAPAARPPAHAPAPRSGRSSSEEAPRLPGLAPADWLVVGEPLDGADAQPRQLLENMLGAIGVGLVAPDRERRAVYCALPGAAASDATAAAAVLSSALATVAPRCVLAFGRPAAAALLGAEAPLGGLRGRIHAHAGVAVVVTFPLVYLLRHPAEKAKAWADLCLAVRAAAAADV